MILRDCGVADNYPAKCEADAILVDVNGHNSSTSRINQVMVTALRSHQGDLHGKRNLLCRLKKFGTQSHIISANYLA